jgi:hypothetical protein
MLIPCFASSPCYATNRTVVVRSGSRSALNGILVVVSCVRLGGAGYNNTFVEISRAKPRSEQARRLSPLPDFGCTKPPGR